MPWQPDYKPILSVIKPVSDNHLGSTNISCRHAKEQSCASKKLSCIRNKSMGISTTESMHSWKCISTQAIFCVTESFTVTLPLFLTVTMCFQDQGLKIACEFSHFSAALSSILHAITPKERKNKTRVSIKMSRS